MEKPTILVLKETEDSIINIINSSNLPAFIVRPMIEKIFNQVQVLEQRELLAETEKYNAAKKKGKE